MYNKLSLKNVFIIIILSLIIFSGNLSAQCEITAYANDTIICQGDSVSLWASGECGSLMNNNFNDGTPGAGWVATTGVDFTNPCGPGPDSIYMWMGGNVPIPRILTTVPFSVTTDCIISFWLKFSIQGQSSPCEGPDLVGEGVSLQYSIDDGITWVTIAYFRPDGVICPTFPYTAGFTSVNSGQTTAFTSWNQYNFLVPPGAVSSATRFRWYQEVYSGQGFDHWGLDIVQILCPTFPYIEWSTGDTIEGPIIVNPTQTTTYSVGIYDTVHDYQAIDSITINVIPYPEPDLGLDTVTCEGMIVSLSPSDNFDSYYWSTEETTSTINVTDNGTYYVTVSNTMSNITCSASDSINVFFVPNAYVELGDDVCVTHPILLDATQPDSGFTYLWSNGMTTPTIMANNYGNYWVSVTYDDYDICGDVDTINVKLIPTASLNLPIDTTICHNESLILSASQSNNNWYQFHWSNGINKPVLFIDYYPPGIYDFEVQVIGCDTTYGRTTVYVEDCSVITQIFIPNAFSPYNTDDINDYFHIYAENIDIDDFYFSIYNRWGQLLFHTTDPRFRWDGKYNGDYLPQGIYTYKLIYRNAENNYKELNGSIFILH
ncbi:MAG: gliding motility-associated C-terminal domain-containing protein [Bacteroidales bacterium]